MSRNVAETYGSLIRMGRIIKRHNGFGGLTMAEKSPEMVIAFVDSIDKELRFTSVNDFFSIFPPIKRYSNDGFWNYYSVLQMREDQLGSHFGKDDFLDLLMTHCYENKYLRAVGIEFMRALTNLRRQETGHSLLSDLFHD